MGGVKLMKWIPKQTSSTHYTITVRKKEPQISWAKPRQDTAKLAIHVLTTSHTSAFSCGNICLTVHPMSYQMSINQTEQYT